LNRRPLGPQPSALPDCATSRRTFLPRVNHTRRDPCYHALLVARAASYIRTDPEGELPTREEQRAAIEAYATEQGHELVAAYEDLEAPGTLLYHRPGLKQAINNIKELEDWEVLVVAHPRCISDTESALHEFVHKFSLYGNRLECPTRSWEELLSAMQAYRRAMSRR
jgi:DNA invertase Pin-like site-specific DNA recombinase